MPLSSGTRLGPYEIASAIGSGGMGEVYRAHDSRLDRDVAVKILAAGACDRDALARFEREGKALAALSHPNILAIHDVGTEGGTAFIVQELLEGETLRQRLSHGALPWRDAVAIAASIADGVAAAHDKQIVHRDLKPDNVFLTTDGVVKVLDFGLAARPPGTQAGTTMMSPTLPGAVLGTVGYMAPEQIRGHAMTPATDIFALGCVLHEMIAGRRPFDGTTPAHFFAAILTEEPHSLPDSAPPELSRIVSRCLEKEPANRRQSARDLAFDLRSLTSSPPSPQPTRARDTGNRQSWRVWATGAAVLALAVTLWLVRRPTAPAADSVAVLPFVNATADRDSDYLADGLTDQLINGLSQIGSLQVLARSTVARYAGQAVDPRDAGHQLKVHAILTGRVSVRAERVRIAVELVDVATGRQVWGDTYDRHAMDVADVSASVSRAVAERLRLKATRSEMARVTRMPTGSGPAYQAYLKGRFEINKRTVDALRRAVAFFDDAVARDGSFAPAHAGRADALALLAYFGAAEPTSTLSTSVDSSLRALSFDQELGEAYASLATAQLFQFRWAESEQAFQRATELSPQYATAHHWYSHYLVAQGRWPESLVASGRALNLEPVNANIAAHLAWHHVYAREPDKAMHACAKTIELDPTYYQAYLFRAQAHALGGRLREAISDLQHALTLPGERGIVLAHIGYAYGAIGERDRAEQVLRELEKLPLPFMKDLFKSYTYAGMGRRSDAIDALSAAVSARNPQVVNLNVEPMVDSLRSDARFQALIRSIGLEPR